MSKCVARRSLKGKGEEAPRVIARASTYFRVYSVLISVCEMAYILASPRLFASVALDFFWPRQESLAHYYIASRSIACKIFDVRLVIPASPVLPFMQL
jgi:hypothetical protein